MVSLTLITQEWEQSLTHFLIKFPKSANGGLHFLLFMPADKKRLCFEMFFPENV